jgi:hypothetical protein
VIHIRQEPLPELKQIALKTYLSGEGASLLEQVISSKATTCMVEAMTPAMESGDFELKSKECAAKLHEAHRYQVCLNILAELKSQPTPFTIAKPS